MGQLTNIAFCSGVGGVCALVELIGREGDELKYLGSWFGFAQWIETVSWIGLD